MNFALWFNVAGRTNNDGVAVMTRTVVGCFLTGLFPVLVSGCAFSSSPAHWTAGYDEERTIDAAGLEAVSVQTHNGAIVIDGGDAVDDVVVSTHKRGGGCTPSDAKAALAAIEVYVEPAGAGSQRIGWRWKGAKRWTWEARVDFNIASPSDIRFDASTHNGDLQARGLTAEASLLTHNGAIDVASLGGRLDAVTHNGAVRAQGLMADASLVSHNGDVDVASVGGRLNVSTHNGRIIAKHSGGMVALATRNGAIAADLSGAAPRGVIATRNGAIRISLGEASSARLNFQTRRGTISSDLPLQDSHVSRSHLTGTIGDGQGALDVTSRNGSIRLAKGSG